MEPDRNLDIVAYVCIALALCAGAYFWYGRDVTEKRVHFRYYLIAIAAAFLIGGSWLGLAWWQLLIAAPVVAAVTWYNAHKQRFCSHCGKPVDEEREPLIIGLHECCHRCHAPLEPRGVFGRRTIAQFSSQVNADAAAARLAAERIQTVILPTPSKFTDGHDLIQLQVEPADESRAREILADLSPVDPMNRST